MTGEVIPKKTGLFQKKVNLPLEVELEIFKATATKPYREVGQEFSLDKFYGSEQSMKNAVKNIVARVKKAPELYGISADAVAIVANAANSRAITVTPMIRVELEAQKESFKDRMDDIRDRTADLLLDKLKSIKTKDLKDINFRDLKDVLAMAVDKSRLLRGESTEAVMSMSKVNVDEMSPQDALKVVLKARELFIESKK